MVTEVKNQLARALAAALLFGCSGGVARAAETDPPYTTRYLGPTGEVLPHDYRPNPESITYFVIHGFRASGQAEPFLRLARAIATRIPNANVVIVDWSVPAQKPTQGNFFGSVVNVYGQYQQSAKTARYIGTDIADWMKKHGVSPAQTVMCGHSLGPRSRPSRARRALSRTGWVSGSKPSWLPILPGRVSPARPTRTGWTSQMPTK